MSYRSLKRVLGETHLERKCRLFFGACLLVLIGSSFGWVWITTEKLVYDTDRSTGRRLVGSIMLKYHWEEWITEEDKNRDSLEFLDLVKKTGDELLLQKYDYEIIALEKPVGMDLPKNVQLPADDWERENLLQLKKDLEDQLAAEAEKAEKTPAGDGTTAEMTEGSDSPQTPADLIPVYVERPRRETPGEYHYYQPVYWRDRCTICHRTSSGAFSAADMGTFFGHDMPFRVVKVVIPSPPTQRAIDRNRAILIANAIITVGIAMIALYVIVRYVIVKPLKHLRDVSDEISRGNTSLRAEISTGDEFEDLANSFNRMLRHLIDTQTELRHVNSDLDVKLDQLAQANMQLYEMNRLKGDFLANMSHELRTPLNSIIGFSEVLQGIDALEDKQKRYAENIQKSGRVLLDTINDILDLAKMESGKMEVRPTQFRIDALVMAQCDLVYSLTEEKNIDLECLVDESLPPLYQDQGKIQQILTNLLSNAIKFTPEGGRITVSASRDDREELQLVVADTGVGIALKDRDVIFEKFRQGAAGVGTDSLTREFSGTGLGLSIVKELCILLGGEVTVESELGKGSEFAVRLPWTRADQPRLDSTLAAKLDDLTKQKRADIPRIAQTPDSPVPVVPVVNAKVGE